MKNPTPNELDLATIHPKKDEKFSPNLYRNLSRNAGIARFGRVYRDKNNTLWLGYIDGNDFIGTKLMACLCDSKCQTFCYNLHDIEIGTPLKEIKGFWKKYQKVGRCAIDPKHQISFQGERWETTGKTKKTRSCKWCGNCTQKQKTFVVRETKTRWVNV